MGETGFTNFDTTVQKTNQVLKQIEQAYGWPKDRRAQSYAALRAVLHALRDRLTVQEAAQLAAQLPTLLRGVYYEGWRPAAVPVKLHREAFLQRVQRDFPYEVDGGTELLVRRVLAALRRHVTDGEWEDIKATVPRDLAAVLP
jgi:uncharacterized protein (DUF2267 family)